MDDSSSRSVIPSPALIRALTTDGVGRSLKAPERFRGKKSAMPPRGGCDISILPGFGCRHLGCLLCWRRVFVRACVSIGGEHARVYAQCQQTDAAVDDARSLFLSLSRSRCAACASWLGDSWKERELKGILQLCTEAGIKTREVTRTRRAAPPLPYDRAPVSFERA